MVAAIAVLLMILAGGCSTPIAQSQMRAMVGAPTVEHFRICDGYGCQYQEDAGLTAAEWNNVRQLFVPRAGNAAEERRRVAQAVALIEAYIGPRTGIAADLPGSPLLLFQSHHGQMDCVDKTINTSTSVTLLEQAHLMVWHRQAPAATRGMLLPGSWPHHTAVVEELATGKRFVIDGWFHAAGVPPEVVPLATWEDGWHPEKILGREAASRVASP